MKTRITQRLLPGALPLLALLAGCSHHRHGGGGVPASGKYAVPDSLAVGNAVQLTGGNFATAYYAPAPVGSPVPAATLGGNGQVVYAPDGSLYRYSNGTGGCAIAKYAFGAIGSTQPLAAATGDTNLTGTTAPVGCYAAATDTLSNLYVLVANGAYLGIDIFDPQLVYQGQLGNGPASGIVATGRIPSVPLAIDASQELFVGQGTTIAVFSTSDRGDVAPSATLSTAAATLSLAFDTSNGLYAGSTSAVSFYPPAATAPSTVLNLPTNLSVAGQSLLISSSNSLALDSANNLYVLTTGNGATQVLRYAANATGNAPYVASVPVATGAQSVTVAPLAP